MFATNGHSVEEVCVEAAASMSAFIDPTGPCSLENADSNLPVAHGRCSASAEKLGSKRREAVGPNWAAGEFSNQLASSQAPGPFEAQSFNSALERGSRQGLYEQPASDVSLLYSRPRF